MMLIFMLLALVIGVKAFQSLPTRLVKLSPLLYQTDRRYAGQVASSSTKLLSSVMDTDIASQQAESANPPANVKFNWEQQWYPLAVEECTDRTRPLHMQLLGKDLVLWFDGKDWRAFDDVCPHRGVRLSEGRIEKEGELLCSYHAWRFDKEGKCSHIPQAETPELEAKQKANPNHCAKVYPVRVEQGLIWVWGESGAPGSDVSLQAALKNPQLIEELTDDPAFKDRVVSSRWNFRHLPYGWDMFMENTVDPAHVPVSHHNLVGNRYTDAVHVNVKTVPGPSNTPLSEGGLFNPSFPADKGFKNMISSAKAPGPSSHEFRPPCLNKIEAYDENGCKIVLILYATPTAPGQCIHIGQQIQVKNEQKQAPKAFAGFGPNFPAWLLHLTAPLFLHQDQGFLHYQQINMFAQTGYAFGRFPPGINTTASVSAFYDLVNMPNQHDKGIAMLRDWISKAGQGGPRWGGEGGSQRWMQGKGMSVLQTLAEPLPNSELFNTFEQHTKHCTICKQTLSNMKKIRTLMIVSLSLIVGQAMWARAIKPLSVVLSGLLGLGMVALDKIMGLFFKYEYHHQDNK